MRAWMPYSAREWHSRAYPQCSDTGESPSGALSEEIPSHHSLSVAPPVNWTEGDEVVILPSIEK